MPNIEISVKNVSKTFGTETVLKNVSIEFEKGKIHGIVGRNGSGKTVLMKCILGFIRPSSGQIEVSGKEIGRDCDFAPDTGMIIETPGFLPAESGRNNLKWLGRLSGGVTGARIDAMMRLVGLDPTLRRGVGKYSLGMRQRLGIAQALLSDPQLLVLDEPMNGLDTDGVNDMRALLKDLKKEGKTVILASHFVQDIDELCDTVSHMMCGELTRER